MIYDAIGGDALAFARLYQETYGVWPSWQAAKVYDAATMAFHALSVAALDGDPSAIAANRTAVRDALAAINTSDVALRGLSGSAVLRRDPLRAAGDSPSAASRVAS